jgi:DNA-binding CsgD family transcriptional regulator
VPLSFSDNVALRPGSAQTGPRVESGDSVNPTAADEGVPILTLSPRQQQVLSLIANGLTDEEIAGRLGISARTVRAHVGALKGKLGVPRRREIPSAYRRLTGKDPFAAD